MARHRRPALAIGGALTIAALLAAAAPAAGAADPVPVAVRFSAELEQRLAADYGREERQVLETLVVESIRRRLARRPALPPDARVEVLVTDARPSHLTRRQAFRQPSLDPLRSRSLGGAALTGTLRRGDGPVRTELRAAYYAPDLATASPAGDAWADARIAIERFAAELARRSAPGG
jgi:hypothetical protein